MFSEQYKTIMFNRKLIKIKYDVETQVLTIMHPIKVKDFIAFRRLVPTIGFVVSSVNIETRGY